MKTTRTRRGMAMMAALLLVTALVPAAMAEISTAEQEVSVTVVMAGVLSIHVDEYVHLGDVYPGQTTYPHTFGTNYTNTMEEGATWSATVTAFDLTRYEWYQPDEGDGWETPTADTISYTNLTIFPGYNDWAATEHGVAFGPEATFTGSEAVSNPVTIFTAPGDFRGSFHTPPWDEEPDLAAWIQLSVPLEVGFADGDWRAEYRTVLTYTLTG